ncbi:mannosyltransferase family protein [Actinospica sp.]|uniref:mannosyltransferase family protein n=1 Tax=Actinospica sp. TaxID=1872142 RepID=UPI002CC7C3D6|nr:mannosyltransferase family protein [Actinospica sp.]HWG23930.1 mannosyltransferase family protein [Actinospica sp.]
MDSDVRLLESDQPASADDAATSDVRPASGPLAALHDRLTAAADPWRARLGIGDLQEDALKTWLLSRVPMLLITWGVAWTGFSYTAKDPHGYASVWQRWDWLRYQNIAADGYTLHARHGASIAFFPGYPILLYVVHFVLRSWVYSGLIISLVCGAIACFALVRIITMEAEAAGLSANGVRTAARDGLILFVWAPAAVFMAAGYTEAPFLACALWAWIYARRGQWLRVGILLALASAIHINGLFVLAGVGILFLQSRPRGLREWLKGWPLALPVLPVAAFMVYLHQLTHSWNAWEHAEATGWNRHITYPWRTLANTWHYAFGRAMVAENAWEYQLELVVTFIGIALVLWLAYKRRWAEFVYVGLSVGTLATSHVYLSVNREMLSWWPLWAMLGVWCVRKPWFKSVYLTFSAPVMFVITYMFLSGKWAG